MISFAAKFLLLLQLLLLISCEVNVHSNGASIGVPESTTITIVNHYTNSPLTIHWSVDDIDSIDSKDYSIPLMVIPPAMSGNITTYVGHYLYLFTLSDEPRNIPAAPRKIVACVGIHLHHVGKSAKLFARNPIVELINQVDESVRMKIKCLAPAVDVWYDDNRGGLYLYTLRYGEEKYFNTVLGTKIFSTVAGHKYKILSRYTVAEDKILYVIRDKSGLVSKTLRDPMKAQEEFMTDYFAKTGYNYVHYFGQDGPRKPPKYFMWPADEVGDVYNTITPNGYWKCKGLSTACQSPAAIDFALEVISVQPKIFLIENFVTNFEISELLQLARSRIVNSREGSIVSDTVLSSTLAVVPRDSSTIVDTIFRRAADILQVKESRLHVQNCSEDLQIFRNEVGQEYGNYYDWDANNGRQSRFITVTLFLSDPAQKGGQTAFPKANISDYLDEEKAKDNSKQNTGFKINPRKGSALVLYNLLEDGNGDVRAYRTSLPVEEGDQWIANLHVWDPYRIS